MTRKGRIGVVVVLGLVLLMPAATFAQNAGLAGIVKDSSGAVMPGVSVEASSPALIEKVRAVVTDTQGLYKIVELPPGVYSVTFMLTGFNTVRREGIQLSTGFTGTVNADLNVGSIEETVTVSGVSPVVDSQNVRTQRVITQAAIEALPTGRTSTGFAQLIPGINVIESGLRLQDVGGMLGEGSRLTIHGGRSEDMHRLINGIPFNNTVSPGTGGVRPDVGAVDEVVVNLSANQAEYQRGGVVLNLIPKEGANRFTETFYGAFANSSLQASNFTDQLRAQGLQGVNRLDHIWDEGFTFGGPIRRDKVWFFTSLRYWGTNNFIAGVFGDSNLNDYQYTPDPSKPAHDITWVFNQSVRLTWQATPRNKFGGFLARQPRASFSSPPFTLTSPEALTYQNVPRNHYYQFNWSSPVTNRLLLEAGGSIYGSDIIRPLADGVTPDKYSIRDTGSGWTFNAPASIGSPTLNDTDNVRFAVSYVTGSHAFKVGFTDEWGTNVGGTDVNNGINLTLRNGVPNQITLNVVPRLSKEKYNALLGVYAQDQWTVSHFTVNAGLRFDYHNSSVPAQDIAASRFLPARHYDEVTNVPNWKDVSPRLGVSYDVFGNGKTAIKGSMSRYLIGELAYLARAVNPLQTVTNSATRTWTDLNGDYIPQCDFLNPVANGECTGPLGNLNFGKPNINTRYDPAYTNGWGQRSDNWEASLGVDHELIPRVAVSGAYYRRWYGHFVATDNLAVTPADFDPFCLTAPVDPRLPGGGGYRICGQYDVNPSKAGQSNFFVTGAEKFGKQTEVFDGVDVSMNARLPNGFIVQGGMATGRSRTNNCFVVDSPQQLYNCDVRPPFLAQYKLLGAYNLPWGVQTSATFQSIPGPQITATYTALNSEIAPSLGRNLSSGANGSATVELVKPGTLFADRMTQVDARFAKTFKVGRTRVKGMVDVFNLLNHNTVLQMNLAYGGWQRPTSILQARLVKFGTQIDF